MSGPSGREQVVEAYAPLEMLGPDTDSNAAGAIADAGSDYAKLKAADRAFAVAARKALGIRGKPRF